MLTESQLSERWRVMSPMLDERAMRLWAAVSTSSGKRIDPEACEWTLDGETLGRGLELWISAPKAGRHVCSVSVRESVAVSVERSFLTWDGAHDQQPLGGTPPQGGGPGRKKKK